MTQVAAQSIQDSLRKGKLVELTSDYRTSTAVRAHLPEKTQCAMSSAAFRQHVLQGNATEIRSRVDAICAALSSVLKLKGEAPGPRFEFRFFGGNGQPQSHPLKLEWFAPNKHWVVLLPDENLRTVMKTD
jgi:hypothetical protein